MWSWCGCDVVTSLIDSGSNSTTGGKRHDLEEDSNLNPFCEISCFYLFSGNYYVYLKKLTNALRYRLFTELRYCSVNW